MLNVSDVVLAETDTCLEEHGYKKLSDSQIEMLKDQIHHITDCDNSVRTLIRMYHSNMDGCGSSIAHNAGAPDITPHLFTHFYTFLYHVLL